MVLHFDTIFVYSVTDAILILVVNPYYSGNAIVVELLASHPVNATDDAYTPDMGGILYVYLRNDIFGIFFDCKLGDNRRDSCYCYGSSSKLIGHHRTASHMYGKRMLPVTQSPLLKGNALFPSGRA